MGLLVPTLNQILLTLLDTKWTSSVSILRYINVGKIAILWTLDC